MRGRVPISSEKNESDFFWCGAGSGWVVSGLRSTLKSRVYESEGPGCKATNRFEESRGLSCSLSFI